MSVLDLKKICADYSVSQSELAQKMGMPPSNLVRMLNNDDIKYSTIIKIAEIVGTTPQDLLGLKSQENEETAQYVSIIESQQNTIKSLQQSIENLTEAIRNLSTK
jgi:plasmid maintenance system antidote protein VapI